MTTKFGRVPLWLYEAGLPLQAVATYGWLAGRYGHYSKITPSYGTLAKELGVSRGSVINYVTALVEAGAVRILESGADGQTSNTYEIAFERPFSTEAQAEGGQNTDQAEADERSTAENAQVEGGQSADQSPEVVSILTRGGQPADRGGQPVVHEEDVLKKTKPRLSLPFQREPSDPRDPAAREGEKSLDEQTQGIADAYFAATGKPPIPKLRTKLLAEAWELLSAGHPLDDLRDVAKLMAAKGWKDMSDALAWHNSHREPASASSAPRASPFTNPDCPTCRGLGCEDDGAVVRCPPID